jgi:hypothetical protein
MNLLLVTFALRNQQRDYSPFFVALRGNALNWWHFIEQTCVITTNHDENSLTQQLIPYIEPTDSVLVIRVTPHSFQGWLPKVAWEALNGMSKVTQPAAALPALTPPPRP